VPRQFDYSSLAGPTRQRLQLWSGWNGQPSMKMEIRSRQQPGVAVPRVPAAGVRLVPDAMEAAPERQAEAEEQRLPVGAAGVVDVQNPLQPPSLAV